MNTDSIKTENADVPGETPAGTTVHININQRSALDCLLDSFRFLRDLKKSEQKTKPSRMPGSAGLLGFGVAYISLGLVSIMVATIIAITHPDLSIFDNQVHFWVGFPFLVSGILHLVAYKFPKKCSMVLVFISLLVNLGVCIAGMFVTVNDLQYPFRFIYTEEICNNLRAEHDSSGRATMPSRYYRDDYNFDLERCKGTMQKYKRLVDCLVMMTLVMIIWGLFLTILSVSFRLKSFCLSGKKEKFEKEKDGSEINRF